MIFFSFLFLIYCEFWLIQKEEDTDLIKRSKGGVNEEEVVCKDGQCSGTKNRRFSRVINKESHHWLPKIHEDYYGPKIHSPRHH